MAKVYIISESWGSCDDSSIVGAFMDEEKADQYVEEQNIPRVLEVKQEQICNKCRRLGGYHGNQDGACFDLKDTCEKAVIKEDRNGLYCENDTSGYHSSSTNSYWKTEVEIIG